MKRHYALIIFLFIVICVNAQPSEMKIVDRIGHVSVFSSENIGTAFVSNLDAKVLGFSETPYDKNMELPDGFRFWLDAVSDAIENGYEKKTATRSNVIPIQIDPFIMTKWGQDKPYYNKCPQVSLKRTLTGCVATSLAQICKYYEYPYKGKGSVTYYVTKTTAGNTETTSKTNVLSDTFDYANMLDSYTGNYNTVQADAVAILMRDCGYATAMNYGREASSANYRDAAMGIANNMGYNDRSLKWLNRMFYSDEEWRDMIYTELLEYRPIMYSGQDPNDGSGHSFVFDGLQPDGFVHINWGWDGSLNGFYDIDAMCQSANYTQYQNMITGFKPEIANEDTPYEYQPIIIADNAKISSQEKELYFTGLIANYDWRSLKGDIAIVIENTTIQQSDTLLLWSYLDEDENGNAVEDDLPSGYGWGFGDGYNNDSLLLNFETMTSVLPYEAGEYKTYYIVNTFFNKEYTCVRALGGPWYAEFSVDEDGLITVTNPSSALAVGIEKILPDDNRTVPDKVYNLFGQPVGDDYRGIVIEQGRKVLRR